MQRPREVRSLVSCCLMVLLLQFASSASGQCQVERITPDDTTALSRFADAVALDGDRAVADGYRGDTGEYRVYVFGRSGEEWTESVILNASDAGHYNFGHALALEGNRLAVAAIRQTEAPYSERLIYTYEWVDGDWQDTGLIELPGELSGTYGIAELELQGDTLVAGVPGDQDGSAFVYTLDAGTWEFSQTLTSSKADSNPDGFGTSVALRDDRLVISASLLDFDGFVSAGAIFVFERSDGVWSESAVITAEVPYNTAQFGKSLDVHEDRIVASSAEDFIDETCTYAGAVRVFERSETGDWDEAQVLCVKDLGGPLGYPQAVGFAGGGDQVVTALPAASILDENSGAIGVFRIADGAWSPAGLLAPLDPNDGDQAGESLAVDDQVMLVGAPRKESGYSTRGVAYLFRLTSDGDGEVCEEPIAFRVAPDGSNEAGDGLSWETAFATPRNAVSRANESGVRAIWIKEGVYAVDGVMRPKRGMRLLGGFLGDEQDESARDPAANPTIFTCEDESGAPGSISNSFMRLTADPYVVIDGFTFRSCIGTNGSNNKATWISDYLGGGATYGTQIRNCTFEGSESPEGSAAIRLEGSCEFTDCRFYDNVSGGGPLITIGPFSKVSRCVFAGNECESEFVAGSVIGIASPGLLANSAFFGNSTLGDGTVVLGGFDDGEVTVVNCVFSGNHAERGGALVTDIRFDRVDVEVVNCTFANNSAEIAGGVYNVDSYAPALRNCVFWDNTDADGIRVNFAGSELPDIYYCTSSQTAAGTVVHNSTADPQFGDADGADDVVGTEDDDLSLAFESPCIDSGNNSFLPLDSADLDGDGVVGEATPYDFRGVVRTVDVKSVADYSSGGSAPRVDRGAFEYAVASGLRFVRGDADGNGVLSIADPITLLYYAYLEGAATCGFIMDADRDGKVNCVDAVLLLGYLFLDGSELEAPFPDCGEFEAEPYLDCLDYVGCGSKG